MHRISITLITCVLSITFILLGCQGNPASPDISQQQTESISPARESNHNHSCLGYYALLVDSATLEIDVIPLRSSEWHFNLTGVLNTTMGVSAVGVPSEHDPPNGLFVFDITLTHPFITKPQFAGFDVRGILMAPGTLNIDFLTISDVDETRLENADGYTRFWNPTEFTQSGMFGYTQGNLANSPAVDLTAMINPYKYFADILYPDQSMSPVHGTPLDDDGGRGVFTAGSSNTRRYRIRFPMDPTPQIVYGYSIDASWLAPVPNPPSEIPDDFPIEANQPEPYDVVIGTEVNTLFYDTETDLYGGVLRIWTNVYDWQGQDAGSVSGDVDFVRTYMPDLFPGYLGTNFQYETEIKARYLTDLWGTAVPTGPGEALVVVKAGSNSDPSYDQGLGIPAPLENISAWRAIPVEIVDPGCDADSNNSLVEAVEIGPDELVTGYLCDGMDSEDWYWFEIPPGYKAEGEIRWYDDSHKSEMELYNSVGGFIIDSSPASIGLEVINISALNLIPGVYYIRNLVQIFTVAGPGSLVYLLETDLDIIDMTPLNPVDVTPPYLDLDATWIERNGDYVYLTGQEGLWVYDISDYLDPQFVSRTFDTCGVYPAFNYPYLYYWEDYSDNPALIDMVDYSDPSNPILHEDVLSVPFEVDCMVMNSENLYLGIDLGGNWKVEIYDYATFPDNPQFVADFVIPDEPMKMLLYDPEGSHTALIIHAESSVRAYEVEDPMNILPKGGVLNMAGITNRDITINGVYLPEVWTDTFNDGGISILSYSPTTGMANEGSAFFTDEFTNVTSHGAVAYVSNVDNGLMVIDFSNPASPVQQTLVPTVSDPGWSIANDGILLNIPEHGGFTVYDTSIPLNPVETARVRALNNPVRGVISIDKACFLDCRDSFNALTAVDINDPANATIWDQRILDGSYHYISSHENVVLIGSQPIMKVRFFDVGNYGFIAPVFSDNLVSPVTSVVLTADRGYVVMLNNFMNVYDTSAFPTVTGVGFIVFPGIVYDLVTYGNYMYGFKGFNLRIFNISNPDVPWYVSDFTLANKPRELSIEFPYLYIATSDTLEIYDITVGDSPSFVGSVVLPNAPGVKFMAVEDQQFAYIGYVAYPTASVTTWPPDSPSVYGEVTGQYSGSNTSELLINAGFLYEMHETVGARIFDLY